MLILYTSIFCINLGCVESVWLHTINFNFFLCFQDWRLLLDYVTVWWQRYWRRIRFRMLCQIIPKCWVSIETTLKYVCIICIINCNFFIDLPMAVEQYIDLIPLENMETTEGPIASSSTYRVTHRHTGQLFALRRLHDFNFAFTKLPLIIEQWKKLSHPNLVQLREVFSTKVFGDQCTYNSNYICTFVLIYLTLFLLLALFLALIFVYDYYPGSLTLLGKYMMVNRIGYEDIDPFNSDPDAPRPYSYQVSYLKKKKLKC